MSTNKTENCHLHAWEAGDNFLRSEINENFTAIDGFLAEMPTNKKLKIATGSYMGDGTDDRPISLGFRPRIIVIGPKRISGAAHTNICIDGVENYFISITDDGFTVTSTFNYLYTHSFGSTNGADLSPFTYMALWWEE